MSDLAIRAHHLGKLYQIGQLKGGPSWRNSLRETMRARMRAVRSFRNRSRAATADDALWALKDVSFEIKHGEVVGIIGRNGAGKSTLLKILSRITAPTVGYADLYGRVGSLLEVGTGFHPELSGRENIYLNGAILGLKKEEIRRRFDEIVAFAEIERFIDTPVKRYSSGMYVRLAFAVAAHLQPEILIVDEVLAVGDIAFQQKCLGKMSEVAGSGRTVLFVSHNLQAIRRLCSRAVLLERGTSDGLTDVETAIKRYSIQPTESNYDVDLSRLSREGELGQKARLLRLRVAEGSSLSYGEPMELVFTIECLRPIPEFALGIGFDTLDGGRVMTLDSDHDRPPLQMPAGVHELRFYMQRVPLHPSNYIVSVGLQSGPVALDVVYDGVRWQVGSGPTDLVGDRYFGGCRLPVEVHHASPIASQVSIIDHA